MGAILCASIWRKLIHSSGTANDNRTRKYVLKQDCPYWILYSKWILYKFVFFNVKHMSSQKQMVLRTVVCFIHCVWRSAYSMGYLVYTMFPDLVYLLLSGTYWSMMIQLLSMGPCLWTVSAIGLIRCYSIYINRWIGQL